MILRLITIFGPLLSWIIKKFVKNIEDKEQEEVDKQKQITAAQKTAERAAQKSAKQADEVNEKMANTLDYDKEQLAKLGTKK